MTQYYLHYPLDDVVSHHISHRSILNLSFSGCVSLMSVFDECLSISLSHCLSSHVVLVDDMRSKEFEISRFAFRMLILSCRFSVSVCGSAKHRFHHKCLEGWLSKSVVCPLCREDVKALLPAKKKTSYISERGNTTAVSRARRRSASTRGALGRTAAGGTVLRYKPYD